jgi:hypothetical protein
MNRDIIDIGRLIAFLGVLPMFVVAVMLLASLPPNPSEYMSQLVATSVGPAVVIWLILSPAGLGVRSSWGESRSKDIIKALLIIISALGAFLLTPYLGIYTAMNNMISQTGAAISMFGGIMIIVGALMKS